MVPANLFLEIFSTLNRENCSCCFNYSENYEMLTQPSKIIQSIRLYSKYVNMKKLITLVLLLMFVSCTKEDNLINLVANDQTILKISVEEGVTSDEKRLFYVVKGENREHLGSGELFNFDEIELTNTSFSGNTIAVSILKYRQQSGEIDIITYVDVPLKKTILINDPLISFSESRANLKLSNFPPDFEEIVIARSGYFSPLDFLFEETFSYSFSESSPQIVVSSLFKNKKPKYQTLNLNDNTETVIDLNQSVDMENKHDINPNFELTTGYEYSLILSGLTNNMSDDVVSYRLYHDINPMISNNEITLYTPSIFQNFNLLLKAKNQNITYIQNTRGLIPEVFNSIDPEIFVSEASISGLNISSVSNQLSYIKSEWSYENSNKISWEIIAPNSVSGNYNLQEIPDLILQEIPLPQNLNSFILESVTATNIDNLTYSQSIDKFFNTDETKTLLTLSKKIDF